MTFRVGMEVICFDASGSLLLVQDARYIISSLELPLYVGVAGLMNGNPEWFPNRFRPIVERKTSIEIFTRMLNPSKVEANA
jgi:hypothetical protein